MQPGESSSKLGRNEMEKYRRMQMKDHVSNLASLIPTQPSRERLSFPALLDQATIYVKQLKDHLEELRQKKEQLQADGAGIKDQMIGLVSPVLAIREMGSILEVNLITGLSKSFTLHQVFSVLQQEGAEVVSASSSTVGVRVFYTIYSQVLSLF
ncbi:unnamed protein product [Ilex paraguariensis]|uniref:BHLH domain-containing protein n=1 Tax=Ilex paraguariensis TaxID=185542 RepID=A0ABC8V284_9AQUA